ncbi:MAG: hypothetical protein ACC645_13370 [Pirellulales bacterium]
MGKGRNRRGRLIYPKHVISPHDLLNFIELKWFTRDWDALKLADEELGSLQVAIMCDPKGSPVIQGTSGLRKLRYSPDGWAVGKRGALRICYVYFERFYMVLLAIVYKKGEQDYLPEASKLAINSAISRIEAELEKRFED